ncbi:hypothetical protein NDU88_001416 [Pleurodeles waltl]|uniref:Uncharacterized protein n=1 Tax=Pleurodeles waltl TaxID=8319 RepID=A0AAV7Q486_PLEWA|nr:hypothetical protein NDU88_001416 [Pleurodeles waltl]
MPAASHLRSLKEEAICSLCLDYFTDPVSVECGHTFCLSCITDFWEWVQTDFPCPQCREILQINTLRPNKQLANMVEILKHIYTLGATPQILCRENEQKLKLFCEDDRELICVVCSVSCEHDTHTVLPVREAAQEHKERFQSYLESLKEKLEDVLKLQRKEELKEAKFENLFKSQRKRITKEFEKLEQILEKEKSCHLRHLEDKEKRSLLSIREKMTKLKEQRSALGSLIAEIEQKCMQHEMELLKEVKSISSRYEGVILAHRDVEPYKDEKEEDYPPMKIMETLEWRWIRSFAAEVTLDPDTAHRRLILSDDGRSVRDGEREQCLPYTPQRYDVAPIVLGGERMVSGRHYWEVEVGDKTSWILGVCDDFVTRLGDITASPEDGYWLVWLRDGEYRALTYPPTFLTPSVPPTAVGLFLDYEAGRLSLYNVDDRSLLFTFSGASFPPTLRPLFCPEVNEEGKNAGALCIQLVTG